jgi:hypothetical protein
MWDSRRQGDKLSWTRTAEETLRQQEEDLKDKIFTVTTKLVNYTYIQTNMHLTKDF